MSQFSPRDLLFHSHHPNPQETQYHTPLNNRSNMAEVLSTDLKTYVPQPRVYRPAPYTLEVPGVKKIDGETIPRRNARTVDALRTVPEIGVNTVYDVLRRASARFGSGKSVGRRKLIQLHEENKTIKKIVEGKEQEIQKKWTYYELSPYEYLSFTELEQLALKIGSGFRALGLQPFDKVHLFAATHLYWFATAHGAGSQSMAIVTAYDTLGEEGLKHSMLQTKAKAIFLDPHLLSKLINPLKEVSSIQHVIYNDDDAPTTKPEPKKLAADVKKLKEAHPNLNILSFSELVKKGEANPVEPVPPKSEDLCCIMYTSGSTGTPKGVQLKHKNVVAAIAGIDTIVGPYLGPGDGMLSYLPLAHILEFMFENACLFWGGTMGYGNPKTISDNSMRNSKGDITEFRPSILVGVPAVWETVKKGIQVKVANLNPIARNMFWGALASKSFLMEHSSLLPGSHIGAGVIDSVVFKKVAEATGGRLRICMNGGGPVAKDTQRFISMCIAPMISGYGLTETSAMGALMDPLAWTDKALGEMPSCVEVKLVDFPDAGYYSTNNPPQGEIWIRGGSVADGYLDLEKETMESFTDDGWFKTGDIGEWDKYGQLKIIDRKKNLVKTLNGEYIALEKLESIYRSCPVVFNICTYASPEHSKPIAIVVPAEPALKQLASENGIEGSGLEDLCANDQVRSLVLRSMQSAGKKGGLSGIEIIDGVVLADEEWTPQNGLITSAQKLNRKGILDKYKAEVKKAYGS